MGIRKEFQDLWVEFQRKDLPLNEWYAAVKNDYRRNNQFGRAGDQRGYTLERLRELLEEAQERELLERDKGVTSRVS